MSNHDDLQHMAGLLIGVTVLPHPGTPSSRKPQEPRRNLELHVGYRQPAEPTTMEYALIEGHAPASDTSSPGSPVVLVQGEPVSIGVTNRLGEPMAVHWHGIESESYYDKATPVNSPIAGF